MREHRHVMERHLGRKLASHEYVHHQNKNKLDNRVRNLEITTPLAHGRQHHLKKSLVYRCVICGHQFNPPKTKRGRNRTCGVRCRYQLISLVEGTDAGWRNWRSRMRRALVNLVERIATQEETQ